MPEPFVNWIASYPRSGNTWVRALLLAYRQGELFNLNAMDAIPGEPHPAYYRALWGGDGAYSRLDWAHMRAVALRQYYHTRRHNPFVLKTHTANIKLLGVPLIPRGYTNKAVYVIRDPRDVLCSCARYFDKSHSEMFALMMEPGHCLEDGGIWQFLSSYSNHVKGWTHEQEFPVHIVRYGDLLQDAGEELQKMLSFFAPDDEVDEERIKNAVEMCSIGKCRTTEESTGFRERPPKVKKFFDRAEEGGWRQELDPAMADELIERLAA